MPSEKYQSDSMDGIRTKVGENVTVGQVMDDRLCGRESAMNKNNNDRAGPSRLKK